MLMVKNEVSLKLNLVAYVKRSLSTLKNRVLLPQNNSLVLMQFKHAQVKYVD